MVVHLTMTPLWGVLYMRGGESQIVWRQMWRYAQNERRNDMFASREQSNTRAKVHKDRDDAVMVKAWEEGGCLQTKIQSIEERIPP